MRVFSNRKPIWTDSDRGFSARFGVNVSRWAVSVYWMFGSDEHWIGLGWW